MVKYYGRFVEMFVRLARPLTTLAKKEPNFSGRKGQIR